MPNTRTRKRHCRSTAGFDRAAIVICGQRDPGPMGRSPERVPKLCACRAGVQIAGRIRFGIRNHAGTRSCHVRRRHRLSYPDGETRFVARRLAALHGFRGSALGNADAEMNHRPAARMTSVAAIFNPERFCHPTSQCLGNSQFRNFSKAAAFKSSSDLPSLSITRALIS